VDPEIFALRFAYDFSQRLKKWIRRFLAQPFPKVEKVDPEVFGSTFPKG